MRWDPREPPEGINVTPVHPLKELATLLAGVAVGTLLVVGVLGLSLDALIARLPAGLESRWLGPVFDGFAETSEHAREQPAAALLARLARHWADNPYELRLVVLPTTELNAFALPGGAVGVTAGLLDEVESENELAFVLAHEVGHFHGRHHLRGIGRGLAIQLALDALVGGGGADRVPKLVAGLIDRRFSRDNEREADRFALELLHAEYGHVAGAERFFLRLPDGKQVGLADEVAEYVSTHPISAERIEALGRTAREHGWPTSGELTPLD